MVVIIMGEIESGGDSVGARVAESLGWEFLDLERPYRGGACGSMNQAKGPSPVELLRAVLDSSIGEWRDVVLSCPVLTEKDQKSLHDNRSLVKFVYLKASDADDATFRLNPSASVQNCMLPSAAGVTPMRDVLILASSMGMPEIIDAVLTKAVLQKPRPNAA